MPGKRGRRSLKNRRRLNATSSVEGLSQVRKEKGGLSNQPDAKITEKVKSTLLLQGLGTPLRQSEVQRPKRGPTKSRLQPKKTEGKSSSDQLHSQDPQPLKKAVQRKNQSDRKQFPGRQLGTSYRNTSPRQNRSKINKDRSWKGKKGSVIDMEPPCTTVPERRVHC